MNALLAACLEENRKLQVWAKAFIDPDYDPVVCRRDAHWSLIRYSDYGDRTSPYGWEFDHFPIPAALGGTDSIWNVRPLHWRNNARGGHAVRNALALAATRRG